MRWLSKPGSKELNVREPDLVKTKEKPKMEVLDPTSVVKKKKSKKQFILPKDQVRTKKHGLHDDGIPAGTLCYLRKRAKEMYGFEFCTVLRTHVSRHGNMAWADVLTPDGNVQTLDVMWLRNTDVQNGNVDEDD